MAYTMLTDNEKAEAVRDYQRRTQGTSTYYKNPIGIFYTDGIKFLADTCGAYWLIDVVASWQPEIAKGHPDLVHFQVWRLFKKDDKWVVDAWSDTPEAPDSEDGPASVRLAFQEIGYSDFPPELAPFEWWTMNGYMILKEEY